MLKSQSTSSPQRAPGYGAGAFVLLVSIGAIVAALGFEHIGGYKPCPLCLQERYAYYAAIPLAFASLVLIGAGYSRAAALVLFAVALGYLVNTGLGTYHAGVEWKYWPGPQTCGAGAGDALATDAGSLLSAIAGERVIRCDEAPWRFAGLSFAGWNAVISLALFAAALKASFAAASRYN